MISEILFKAAEDIEKCEEQSPELYAELSDQIFNVKNQMVGLGVDIDAGLLQTDVDELEREILKIWTIANNTDACRADMLATLDDIQRRCEAAVPRIKERMLQDEVLNPHKPLETRVRAVLSILKSVDPTSVEDLRFKIHGALYGLSEILGEPIQAPAAQTTD